MPELQKPFPKRQIAYKVKIADIINGEYVREEGFSPNYLITPNGKHVSRVNIIGTVVLKSENDTYKSVVIDDGSGKISVRSFNEPKLLDNIEVGDTIILIGKPRQFGEEKYILPEIVKKVNNPLWMNIRNLELKNGVQNQEEKITGGESTGVVGSIRAVLSLITELDTGNGADVEELIKKLAANGINNAEAIIENLLKSGEIFELRAGKVKLL